MQSCLSMEGWGPPSLCINQSGQAGAELVLE